VAANAFQPQAGSNDPGWEKDVYAIYSLMLTNPRTSHGVGNNKRPIAMNTKPPSVQRLCMRSPKTRKQSFAHVRIGALVGLDIVCRQWLLTPNITMVSNPVHARRSQ
jgi:hypothetical protein